MADADYERFIEQIKKRTAIDLAQYKETQMKRRLTTLRQKHGYNSFTEYMDALVRIPALMDEFLDRMTINVSEFWRNPNRWEILEKRFLPEMTAGGGRISIWSAACSTGDEPYTTAMILDRLGMLGRAEITATDLDHNVLAKAQGGLYQERSVRDVPKSYLKDYFTVDGDVYAVDERIKRSIRFKQHNLLYDPFGGPYDLIICRNVMIYFTEEAKHGLYQRFANSLKPGGILFVGSTEQIFSPQQYGLETAETFFYRKKMS
ncbi:CheR family methyltransferase [Paenibacillus xylaniclasticus]|uniref:CheR family methyltransferase n=1 Tax=Paenibacillus xylaniclasticus TaxID=588083 RepID=UPI000FD81884|nr:MULTISPECIES: protein-glutamate O-methyltransferase CheR [Paenibacillus]GFN30649.1 chemotaxis protein methyltransferase [Paenibacillus curdlanolyticus]